MTFHLIDSDFKEWVDNASYYELLKRWRFAKAGDEIFLGALGEYFSKVMQEKRQAHANPVLISKEVGW